MNQVPLGLCKYTPKWVDLKLMVQHEEHSERSLPLCTPVGSPLPFACLSLGLNHKRLLCLLPFSKRCLPKPLQLHCPLTEPYVRPRGTCTSLPCCHSCKGTPLLTSTWRDPSPPSAHPWVAPLHPLLTQHVKSSFWLVLVRNHLLCLPVFIICLSVAFIPPGLVPPQAVAYCAWSPHHLCGHCCSSGGG